MGWFDSWHPKPPAEFSFLGPAQYAQFMKLVRREVLKKDPKAEVLEDRVVSVDHRGNKQHIFLSNLARVCLQLPKKTWADVIIAHFKSIARNNKEMIQLDERIGNYNFVEPLLAVRVCPPDGMSDHFVHRVDLDGTVSVLVFDLPETIRYVHPDLVSKWGKTIDELFDVGLDNVRISCVPEPKIVELAENKKINILYGDSFFVASHALMLKERADLIGPHGVIFGVPIRHAVLSIPVDGPDVIHMIPHLAQMTMDMARRGPGSITTRLYWQNEDQLHTIECKFHEKEMSLTIKPPEQLISLLEALGGSFESD